MPRTKRMWLFDVLVLSALGALAACGSGSPTVPSVSTTASPSAATVTGSWGVSFVEVPVTALLTLNETAAAVSGTLRISGEPGTGSLNGTITAAGQMTLTGREPSGAPATLQAAVDAARTSFTGSLRIAPPGEQASTLTARGARRGAGAPGGTEPPPGAVLGTARLISMSVPPGSTLVAQPLGASGQQVGELWATVGITLNRDVSQGGFQVFLGTPQARCLGVGRLFLDFAANQEKVVQTFTFSNSGTGPPPPCPLPYSTSQVEILVFDSSATQLFAARFPAAYHFVAP